jgi:hypothetical protein
MPILSTYTSTPLGSLVSLTSEQRLPLLTKAAAAPPLIQDMLTAVHTGAFVRGLVKAYDLVPEHAQRIAFIILRVTVGEEVRAQIPSLLASELSLSTVVAQKIAIEIERDLFAPIALELNKYLSTRKKTPTTDPATPPSASAPLATNSSAATHGMRNVLDLKNKPAAPKPAFPPRPSLPPHPPLPPRPPLRPSSQP